MGKVRMASAAGGQRRPEVKQTDGQRAPGPPADSRAMYCIQQRALTASPGALLRRCADAVWGPCEGGLWRQLTPHSGVASLTSNVFTFGPSARLSWRRSRRQHRRRRGRGSPAWTVVRNTDSRPPSASQSTPQPDRDNDIHARLRTKVQYRQSGYSVWHVGMDRMAHAHSPMWTRALFPAPGPCASQSRTTADGQSA